jgi:hypothetical protein
MALSIIQAGSSLQLMDTLGGLQTLTLPTGVTLRTDVPPRWVVDGRYVVLVNTPSQPLTIDALGVVRLLTPKPPRLAPILTGPNAGGLSGTFRSKMTFAIIDSVGNIISESDYGPFSAPVSIAAKSILASNLDISPDQINQRRLYRTTDNGAVYFQWVDLDGNIITSVQDDLSDAGLSLFAAPILGTPPRLTTIAEFRGRLWGTGDVDIDHLRYTEAGFRYAWPAENVIEIPAVGSDEFGIVALAPRREALGVGRRNTLVQITGSGAEIDGIPDFDRVILSKECGIESQETAKVFRDTAYFLWKDGVYSWGSEGIVCISDGDNNGKGNVRSWFVTDDYFNRDLFTRAFAHIDAHDPIYRLFLASAGSDTIDSWVEYDLNSKTWWGPHSTELFRPTSAFTRSDAAAKELAVIGSHEANVYDSQDTRTDGTATAIEFDAIGKRHDLKEPDQNKYFGEISILGKVQDSGELTVTSRVGELNATTNAASAKTRTIVQPNDLRKNRQRLGRIGQGKHAQIELTNAQVDTDVVVYGFEIDPVNLLGRR